MVNKKEIVSTMISQHRELQEKLGSIFEESKKEKTNSGKILDELGQFKDSLLKHLKLEDSIFYVELLKEMRKKSQGTTDTESFIKEMDGIKKVVVAFLEKYSNEASIKEGKSEFSEELSKIIDALNLRIESEEPGVYDYWQSI